MAWVWFRCLLMLAFCFHCHRHKLLFYMCKQRLSMILIYGCSTRITRVPFSPTRVHFSQLNIVIIRYILTTSARPHSARECLMDAWILLFVFLILLFRCFYDFRTCSKYGFVQFVERASARAFSFCFSFDGRLFSIKQNKRPDDSSSCRMCDRFACEIVSNRLYATVAVNIYYYFRLVTIHCFIIIPSKHLLCSQHMSTPYRTKDLKQLRNRR